MIGLKNASQHQVKHRQNTSVLWNSHKVRNRVYMEAGKSYGSFEFNLISGLSCGETCGKRWSENRGGTVVGFRRWRVVSSMFGGWIVARHNVRLGRWSSRVRTGLRGIRRHSRNLPQSLVFILKQVPNIVSVNHTLHTKSQMATFHLFYNKNI